MSYLFPPLFILVIKEMVLIEEENIVRDVELLINPYRLIMKIC